jgi:eukaryotic-like serine/threonine-protein kinase
MDDPKSKKGRRDGTGIGGPQGVGVPAKGDSAADNEPLDDGRTISDVPITPPPVKPAPPAKRPASKATPQPPPPRPNPDATIVETPPGPPAPATPKPTTPAVGHHPDATISDSLPATPASTAGRALSGIYMKETILQPGDLVGARYEILALLGEGGMGAVYKALDREVERTVALKLIRPELASNPAILARFKQELLTAHQVTHKNVIRIYDIAEADGVKFITMEFVEGRDLRHVLTATGKLPVSEAVEIVRQVCYALDAAHGAGVIHRDLKPQNIMQEDRTGRILVMDFGLARTIGGDGMTQTGALLGTIEYMSPEQSMGKPLDQRSDIFAVGLIFYELLTGNTPYKADSIMASLLRRNQERAIPAADLDPTIPKALSDVVSKCLERDLEQRYQNVQQILSDLDAFQGARPTFASLSLPPQVIVAGKPEFPWKWVAIGSIVVAILSGGWFYRGKLTTTNGPSRPGAAVKVPEVSLAILPFRNASGDDSLDWLGATLADMLSTGVGQSAQMRVVAPDALHQVLSDLRITPESSIDATMIAHIADSSGTNTIFWGKYVRLGDGKIRIDGTLRDLKHDKTTSITVDAPNEKDISTTATQIAEQIRQHLSVSADVLKELKASSFQPSSKSAAALRDYTQAVQFLREGRNLEAVKGLETTVKQDPDFALAYARLAEANSNLGYEVDAERYSRKALDLSQSLPQGEKYFIEAMHSLVAKDSKKALDSYENLAKILPGNTDVAYALGTLYLNSGDYDKARTQFTKILTADPKNIMALWQMSGVDSLQDNPQTSLDPLNKALSQAIQTDNQEAKALILQSLGISYRLMNKPQEAMKNYLDSMEISKKLGLKRLLASNLGELAVVQITLGKPDAAMDSYGQSLQIEREIGMKKDYGDSLINRGLLYQTRGEYDKALQDYKDALAVQRDANDESLQSVCLNNIGESYFAKGDTDNALIYLQQSLELRRKVNQPGYLAETLGAIGDVYSAIGDYGKSLTNLMNALDISRKANNTSAAAGVSGSIGTVLLAQGRLGAAVSAMQDAVKGYRAVNNRSLEMATALISLGDTLALSARGGEAGKLLDEAQDIARDLKNENINSQLLNGKGDVAFYQGDLKTAKVAYEQAAAAASKGKQKDAILMSKMNQARLAIAEGRSQSATGDLRTAIQMAESLHLKYYAIRSSVDLAQALINAKDYGRAREQLDSALAQSEKLGLRLELARTHYFLGEILRLGGNPNESVAHYQLAHTMFDEIRKEPGAEHVLDRFDLKEMYATAGRSVVATK